MYTSGATVATGLNFASLHALIPLTVFEIMMFNITSCTTAALVAAALLSPRGLAAQNIDLQLGASHTAMVVPNGKLTVPVVVNLAAAGAANITSLSSGMAWGGSKLTLDSLRVVSPGWSMTGGVPATGAVTFSTASSTPFAGTGTLANAYFTAAATPGGTRISISPSAAQNQSGTSILSLLRSRNLDACVAVSGKGGDVSVDNVVNIVDSQQLARYAVGLSVANTPSLTARGDVDANAAINIVDAQQVARFAVGLSVAPVAAGRINVELFAPPAVGSMTVSPSGAQTLAAGSSLQITATPLSGGNDLSGCAAITWSTSNASVATVSASGLVTAVASGTAVITAGSATSPGATATISVTVPSAAAVLFSEDFESANLAPHGWYDNTTAVLSTAEKYAGNSSAQFRYLAGATTPTSGNSMRHKFTPTSSLYISYYAKFSANWVGSGQAYHPHEFYAMTTMDEHDYMGPSHSWLTVYLEHNYQNGLKPMMGMQDNLAINTTLGTPSVNLNLTQITENRSVSGCNGIVETGMIRDCFSIPGETPPWYNGKHILGPVAMQPNPGANYKGNWNFVEGYFQMNTIVNGIGIPNGVLQYWLNGTLIINRTDVLFRTGARPNIQFNKLLIAPYIGSGSPVDQSMYIDNLVVKTAR